MGPYSGLGSPTFANCVLPLYLVLQNLRERIVQIVANLSADQHTDITGNQDLYDVIRLLLRYVAIVSTPDYGLDTLPNVIIDIWRICAIVGVVWRHRALRIPCENHFSQVSTASELSTG